MDLLRGISTGFSQDLLIRTCARSCQDLLEDFTRSFPQGISKDLDRDLHARTPKRIPRGHHKRNKILTTRISTRSSDKGLHKILQEPAWEDLSRTPADLLRRTTTMQGLLSRISPYSSKHLLTSTSVRPWSRSSCIAGYKTLRLHHEIRDVQGRHQKTFQRTVTRSLYRPEWKRIS